MITIYMHEKIGNFASNKDIARDIRTSILIPSLESGEKVLFDFEGVEGATQSFVHALISEGMRKFGISRFLESVSFKSCNQNIQTIVTIVTDYMQAGLGDEE
jgi:hypothetical protein